MPFDANPFRDALQAHRAKVLAESKSTTEEGKADRLKKQQQRHVEAHMWHDDTHTLLNGIKGHLEAHKRIISSGVTGGVDVQHAKNVNRKVRELHDVITSQTHFTKNME